MKPLREHSRYVCLSLFLSLRFPPSTRYTAHQISDPFSKNRPALHKLSIRSERRLDSRVWLVLFLFLSYTHITLVIKGMHFSDKLIMSFNKTDLYRIEFSRGTALISIICYCCCCYPFFCNIEESINSHYCTWKVFQLEK